MIDILNDIFTTVSYSCLAVGLVMLAVECFPPKE